MLDFRGKLAILLMSLSHGNKAVYLRILQHFESRGLVDAPLSILVQEASHVVPIKDFSETLKKATAFCSYLASSKCQFLYPGHPIYPESFWQLDHPPLGLFLLGPLETLQRSSLSVVGARRASYETYQWMRSELKGFISRRNLSIVSGGALGVDLEAHEIGAYHGAGTVIILPSGLEQIYPLSMGRRTVEFLDRGGLFLSEWSPWEKVRPFHFHHRNRLIAALTRGTLVLEAGERSGTMLTAKWCADLGREVGVVPGSPLTKSYRGSLALLQDGAALIRDEVDLEAWWTTDVARGLGPEIRSSRPFLEE